MKFIFRRIDIAGFPSPRCGGEALPARFPPTSGTGSALNRKDRNMNAPIPARMVEQIGHLKTSFEPPPPSTEERHAEAERLDALVRDRQRLRQPEAVQPDRLAEIATLVRSLTYGEMIALAEAVWKLKPEGEDLTDKTLPGTLHRWATSGGA